MAAVDLNALIVPEVFKEYMWMFTREKLDFLTSGIIFNDATLTEMLASGGYTYNVPHYNPPTYVAANISGVTGGEPTPGGITAGVTIGIGVHRNRTWEAADLIRAYTGSDPLAALIRYVARYWGQEKLATLYAILAGILADNDAAPTGGDTHTRYDLTFDASNGGTYAEGVTSIDSDAVLEALYLMGDAVGDLTDIAVHSMVAKRLDKQDLIDSIPDSQGRNVRTYMGRRLHVVDTMPYVANVFDTYLFGPGLFSMADNDAATTAQVVDRPLANNGGGSQILSNRVNFILHPNGYSFVGSATAIGGPSNAATSNNFAAAGSWSRRATERKMIPFVRLKTAEMAA